MHLAPVRPPLVATEDLFDMAEVWLILHTPVHVHCQISRITLVGRAQPDIIGVDETTLQGEVDCETMPVDTILDLSYSRADMVRRNIILHLLEAHPTGCGEQAMAIVDLVNRSDSLRGELTN